MDGSYSFNDLPLNNYTVREQQQQDFLQTTPETVAVSLTSDQPDPTVNIGNTFGFSGRKFNDLNGNGILDEGEPGLREVTIYIDINNNEILDDGDISTTTDDQGNYRLFTSSDIPNGTYFVREVAQEGFQQTTLNPVITIDDGEILNVEDTFNVNFGNQQQQVQGRISGTKFNDLDGDGNFDPDEPGIPNVTIYLDQNRNEVFDQDEPFQFTDIDGNYRFDNLTPGEYIVREVVPLNFRPTLTPQQPITITAAGENVPDINFGNTTNIAGISITQTDGRTNVTEGLTTDTSYQIVLDSIPDGVVNIAIAPDNQTNLGAGPGIPITRSFDSTNALTPQIINVTAVDDDVAEGPHFGNITHSVTSIDDPNYNSQTVPFTVDGEPSPFVVTANITDNDTPAVSTSVTTTQAAEGGFTGAYSLVLTTQPIAPVTINFETGEEIQAIDPIIFDSTNWNSERLITVTAIDDFDIEGDHFGIINHLATSTGGDYNGINILPVTVDITDNDLAGVSINPTDIEVTEGGATGSYEVVLTTQPTLPVRIDFDTGDQIQGINSITFDDTNWNVGRSINVTAIDDSSAEGNHIGTIRHIVTSEDMNYDDLEISQVTTNITDNDTPAVSIRPLRTNATEGGETGSYEVVLTTQPTLPVRIDFDTGEQIQGINSITFDNTNWDRP
ncbi:SdrD B-like domain-containing protein, partial [Hydrocoleum sp. CS-953]|uniref:SdrD B-like domain-containing protein n=1 Tax=Hydrocoleum sp. CS-953 TaxID=1671698 RepID=UPI00352B9BA2